jgi:hypothetical protein
VTALAKYRKLESRGLWRDLPEAQRREVVVNLGEATLVLSDPKSGAALTHWSLPAVERSNPGTVPALFTPGPDAAETLELDDPVMVAALDTVHRAIVAAQPRQGRLRGVIFGASAVGIVAGAVFWLPDALVARTAAMLPPATEEAIGDLVAADLTRLTGAPCAAPEGLAILKALSTRIFGAGLEPEVTVVRDGVTAALALPGNRIVVGEPLIALPDGPDVLAGHLVATRVGVDTADPMLPLLHHAGTLATLKLFATGALEPDAVAGYAETLRAAPPVPVSTDLLLVRLKAAGVAASPYAYALDPSGETTLPLIEADPFAAAPPPPLLSDQDWIALQDICSR